MLNRRYEIHAMYIFHRLQNGYSRIDDPHTDGDHESDLESNAENLSALVWNNSYSLTKSGQSTAVGSSKGDAL